MKKMSKEKQKEVEQTQELLFETFLKLVSLYCEEIDATCCSSGELSEIKELGQELGQHVQNLSLAILAHNSLLF